MAPSSPNDATTPGFVSVQDYLNLSSVRGNYCSISARVLFLWDYCVTLEDEIRYVWGCRMTAAMLLFMINRYVNLAITVMEIMDQAPFQTLQDLVRGSWNEQLRTVCSSLADIAGPCPLHCCSGSDNIPVFASLRIYAIWDCSWRLALSVLVLALISPVITIVSAFAGTQFQHMSDVLQFVYSNQIVELAPPPSVGCALYIKNSYSQYERLRFNNRGGGSLRQIAEQYSRLGSSSVELANQASTVAFYGLALFLTMVKALQLSRRATQRKVEAGLIHFLLRDGTLYFMMFVCINLTQLLITAEIAEINVDYLGFYVAPMTSILISRFLLNLRKAARQREATHHTSVYLTSYLWSAGVASDKTDMGGPIGNRPRYTRGDSSDHELDGDIELFGREEALSSLTASPRGNED
ncbi:uncharacterized protein PHACADRAFT_27649 [Phanerochaete carnosa HHB-10118-sp]|uniref:DUF6533 domain-containing protein n=1 Tax=Phanerochaete carnosa (strain HHB-10118-sp) TaxID=650164 RepID=K5V2V4_PHACS|nr:uncharacterized protein PHACADRAFT_27649 [Phanerochaete carnosa HHB-10118-sp]EKM56876.1 hypothetical protein PHACADRAFT_27649 [Phanerochaete carnosa HHB-10118-sp]